MGVLSESSTNGEIMASKPRFQVVAVPSTFTRGRWECRDFEDQHDVEKEILEFEKSSNDSHATRATQETTSSGITFTAPEAKESSTILVTSVVSTKNFNHAHTGESHHGVNSVPETTKTVSTNVVHYEVPPTNTQSHGQPTAQPIVTQFVQQTEIVTTAKPEILSTGQPNVSAIPNAGVVTISTKTQEPIEPEAVATTTGVSIAGSNVVAIDNKIEQAMDLVKTHLTFAVREEVEILKNTILELESKVALLENQNQILRQYAPPEVVINLPLLVQSTQILRQQLSQPAGVISPPVSNTQPQFPTGAQAVTVHHNVTTAQPGGSLPPRPTNASANAQVYNPNVHHSK